MDKMQNVNIKVGLWVLVLFFLLNSSCENTKDCEEEYSIVHFDLQVRPSISIMNGNLGVPNLNIVVNVSKMYCDGTSGDGESIKGTTNGAGIYESPGSWTLNITSGIDKVIVFAGSEDGEWLGSSCIYEYGEFSSSSYFQPHCILQYSP
jgi:hypothetical protein